MRHTAQCTPVEAEDEDGREGSERLGAKRVLLLLTAVTKILVVPRQPFRPCVAQQASHLQTPSDTKKQKQKQKTSRQAGRQAGKEFHKQAKRVSSSPPQNGKNRSISHCGFIESLKNTRGLTL